MSLCTTSLPGSVASATDTLSFELGYVGTVGSNSGLALSSTTLSTDCGVLPLHCALDVEIPLPARFTPDPDALVPFTVTVSLSCSPRVTLDPLVSLFDEVLGAIDAAPPVQLLHSDFDVVDFVAAPPAGVTEPRCFSESCAILCTRSEATGSNAVAAAHQDVAYLSSPSVLKEPTALPAWRHDKATNSVLSFFYPAYCMHPVRHPAWSVTLKEAPAVSCCELQAV